MSKEARTEHLSKKQACFDSLKGNRVPESNCCQSSQMNAVIQLLTMAESERTQLCSQANTLQLLNSSQQNNTSILPIPVVSNNNGNSAPRSANVGNLLTQLSHASSTNNNVGDQRRIFAAKSGVVHTNDGVLKSIVKNADIPE